MTTSYNGHILKHATVEDFERWDSPGGALMTDEEYDRHFKRIRKMLVKSGDYDEFFDNEVFFFKIFIVLMFRPGFLSVQNLYIQIPDPL